MNGPRLGKLCRPIHALSWQLPRLLGRRAVFHSVHFQFEGVQTALWKQKLRLVCHSRHETDLRRPSLSDVESLSRGKAARQRGTGSRRIPHRLNAEERKIYDIAKDKNYLVLKGSGYRKERKGSPLANTFRQWCDATARPCVVIEQGVGSDPADIVVLDLVTLRQGPQEQLRQACTTAAARLGAVPACDVGKILPFDILASTLQETFEPDDIQRAAMAELPIWQLPPQALAFSCQRATAKQLAQAFLDCAKASATSASCQPVPHSD